MVFNIAIVDIGEVAPQHAGVRSLCDGFLTGIRLVLWRPLMHLPFLPAAVSCHDGAKEARRAAPRKQPGHAKGLRSPFRAR